MITTNLHRATPDATNKPSETTELDLLIMHLNEAKATAFNSREAARALRESLIGDVEPSTEEHAGVPVGGGLLGELNLQLSAIRDINAETISHLMNIRKAINAL